MWLQPGGGATKLVIVGEKARSILGRTHAKDIAMHFSEIGRKPPTFTEASLIAQQILASGVKFDAGEIVYNRFKSVISYSTTALPVYAADTIAAADGTASYELEDDILQNFQEFSLAAAIYYCLAEASASELSARMTAMDNASKNAGEVIQNLTLQFNRTRQAVITRELIEIISGASALD